MGVVHSSASYSNHVAVVQLVEHQIVALVVEDSSSSGHPICRDSVIGSATDFAESFKKDS